MINLANKPGCFTLSTFILGEAVRGCITTPDVTNIAMSGNSYFSTIDNLLFLSPDNGATWKNSYEGDFDRINDLEFAGDKLFSATNEGVAIYNSSDSTWDEVGNGLPYDPVNALVYDGNLMVAGTDGGVYRSTDNGNNWNQINTGLLNTTVLSLDSNGDIVFAGTEDGFYSTMDMGENWTERNNGLPDSTRIISIVAWENNVFAGTAGSGIFFSDNNGDNWSSANDGLLYLTVQDIATDSGEIYIATGSGGVLKKSLTQAQVTAEGPESDAGMVTLYPNPASDHLILSSPFMIRSIAIFSADGKMVAREEVHSKTHTLRTQPLPRGIYILKISANETICMRRFMKY